MQRGETKLKVYGIRPKTFLMDCASLVCTVAVCTVRPYSGSINVTLVTCSCACGFWEYMVFVFFINFSVEVRKPKWTFLCFTLLH